MAKLTNTLIRRIKETNRMITQCNKDEVWAVETDSTWESTYTFNPIRINKYSISVSYEEHSGQGHKQETWFDIDDIRYAISWIRRCIKKGYREEGKKYETF